jgi:hypothetical protein
VTACSPLPTFNENGSTANSNPAAIAEIPITPASQRSNIPEAYEPSEPPDPNVLSRGLAVQQDRCQLLEAGKRDPFSLLHDQGLVGRFKHDGGTYTRRSAVHVRL